uniref:BACK domain-containing protein n=2 Tax=Photinus pyralis TaxID=7054 RepID=A0A1Y1NCK5_PHOPY
MVVVANEPIEESEPMMKAEASFDDLNSKLRRNSYAEEAYKNITSSMKADPLQIRSPKTAIELLSTGVRLQNMPLVKQCIENLDHQLDKTNVLMIYSSLSKCKMPTSNKNDFEPSAPPIIENETQRDTDWVQELTDSLRHNCLLVIDKNADYILKQKEILELSYLDLINITERDTLQVTDEMLIYSVIHRWAIEECHRRTLNTHLLNLKAVLRQLSYTPRYGLMSKAKFMTRTVDNVKGPSRSGILEEKEWRLIKFYIEEKSKKRPVEELLHKWSRPRTIGNEKPKVLSRRSSSPHAGNTSSNTSTTNCQSKTTCEKCLLNFLTCWTAIFD